MKHNSQKDYLEAIMILANRNGNVRSVDISKELDVSKPSVCCAMKKLQERNMIAYGESGNILLTDSGMRIAENIKRKREILCKLLMSIGLKEDIAYVEAGKIERVIGDEAYECARNYLHNSLKKI